MNSAPSQDCQFMFRKGVLLIFLRLMPFPFQFNHSVENSLPIAAHFSRSNHCSGRVWPTFNSRLCLKLLSTAFYMEQQFRPVKPRLQPNLETQERGNEKREMRLTYSLLSTQKYVLFLEWRTNRKKADSLQNVVNGCE